MVNGVLVCDKVTEPASGCGMGSKCCVRHLVLNPDLQSVVTDVVCCSDGQKSKQQLLSLPTSVQIIVFREPIRVVLITVLHA